MAEIDLSLLFPKGQARPVTIKSLLPKVQRIRSYSQGYKIKWLDSNRPQPTIGKDHSQKPTRWLIDGTEHRPTTEELCLVSSFPKGYRFSGNDNDAWNRIGNSVPPMLTRAIAMQIKHILFNGESLIPYPKAMSYLEILESAWLDHLKPKAPDAPTVISTFAGGGGSSLGYSMAGYRELLAVEWDDNAVATFRLNFPEIPVYHGDIAKLSVEECLKLAGIEPGELDLLDGSPPCQGFSTAGKRILDDPRNQLFREYVRLLRGLKPKVFLMENVSGMVKGKMKLVFAEIMRELKASGYRVSARLMNAMYFNVPQSRQRMIFIGVREDLGIEPSHPKGESRPTPGRVIEGAGQEGLNGKYLLLNGKTSKLIKLLKPGQGLEQLYEHIHGKGKKAYFAFSRLHPDRPSRTIAKDSAGLFHYTEDRTLSIGEYKRIASFPDDYQFIGSFTTALQRIGNSVPPLFIRSIAAHIQQEILSKVTSRDSIRLSE